jgi:hypothetical protein
MALKAVAAPLGSPVGGSGTPGTIPVWSSGTTLGDSVIKQSGSFVGVNTGAGAPTQSLHVVGTMLASIGNVSGQYVAIIPGNSYGVISGGAGLQFSAAAAVLVDGTSHSFRSAGGGSTRMTIDSSGHVGIGTASPGALLDVNTGSAPGSYVTSTRLSQTGTAANSGQRILFYNSQQTWEQGAIGSTREGANANFALTFFTSVSGTNAERMRIDSSGNVILNTANTGATIQAAGSQQGLKLPATPGATGAGTEQILDCYQENTWTATDGSGAGLTFTVNNTAVLTRVGRLVHVRIDITFPVTANVSNALINLPFNAINYGGTASGFVTGVGSALFLFNGSGIEVYNAAGSRQTNANLSAARIIISAVYQAA